MPSITHPRSHPHDTTTQAEREADAHPSTASPRPRPAARRSRSESELSRLASQPAPGQGRRASFALAAQEESRAEHAARPAATAAAQREGVLRDAPAPWRPGTPRPGAHRPNADQVEGADTPHAGGDHAGPQPTHDAGTAAHAYGPPPAYEQHPWNPRPQTDAEIDAHVDGILSRHGRLVPSALRDRARPMMQRYFRRRRDNGVANNGMNGPDGPLGPNGPWGRNDSYANDPWGRNGSFANDPRLGVGNLANMAGTAASTAVDVFMAFENFMLNVAKAEASLINNSGQVIAYAAKKQ
jgi:hypothetical protein